MLELSKIVADFTPGAVGIWTGVLLFLAHMVREWRETRKLSADDRLARREGYAKQVESLMRENRALREDLARMEQVHSEHRRQCHEETDLLRRKIRALEDELSGLQRARKAEQNSVAALLLENNPKIFESGPSAGRRRR